MNAKTIQIITCLLILSLLSSCRSDNTRSGLPTNEKNIPSSIMEEDSYASDLFDSEVRWKGSKDIVEKLFEEAMEKDKELRSLNKRINQKFVSEIDSLASYDFYAETNNNYWEVANRYTTSIIDSLLRNKMKILILEMESDYRKSVLPYEGKKLQILNKSIALSDQLVALKLMTSLKMISQYQKHGIPKINQLEHLINDYKLLIKESQAVIEQIN